MITWLSTTLMMFIDRLFLAHFSLEALGAAVNAGTIAWAFAYGFQLVLEMAQVVIAQYNGAKRFKSLGAPAWQMIWLALGSTLVFVPLALSGGSWFFLSHGDSALQETYFSWLVVFGPAFGLIGACSAFFIGRGEAAVVKRMSIIGNLCNVGLDWILIFGVDGYIPAMGVKGAAIATGIGMLVQGLLLFWAFIRRQHREEHGVDRYQWNWDLCKRCLRVGLPPGVGLTLEMLAWGMFFSMMAQTSAEHLTVTSLCHSLIPLFACVTIGLQRGAASLSGNLIGAGLTDRLNNVLRSGCIILVGYFIILAGCLWVFSDSVIALFVAQNAHGDASQMQTSVEALRPLIRVGLLLSSAYLFIGGLRTLAVGILSAAGDTFFLMIAGTASVWAFLVAPTYWVVVVGGASVTTAQSMLVLYGVAAAVVVFARYRQGKWRDSSLLIEPATTK